MYISHQPYYDKDKNLLMARKGSWIQDLFIGMALIGGAWMTYDILKKYSKRKIMYHCPECDALIDYNIKQCPYCETGLIWPE